MWHFAFLCSGSWCESDHSQHSGWKFQCWKHRCGTLFHLKCLLLLAHNNEHAELSQQSQSSHVRATVAKAGRSTSVPTVSVAQAWRNKIEKNMSATLGVSCKENNQDKQHLNRKRRERSLPVPADVHEMADLVKMQNERTPPWKGTGSAGSRHTPDLSTSQAATQVHGSHCWPKQKIHTQAFRATSTSVLKRRLIYCQHEWSWYQKGIKDFSCRPSCYISLWKSYVCPLRVFSFFFCSLSWNQNTISIICHHERWMNEARWLFPVLWDTFGKFRNDHEGKTLVIICEKERSIHILLIQSNIYSD